MYAAIAGMPVNYKQRTIMFVLIMMCAGVFFQLLLCFLHFLVVAEMFIGLL